MAWSWRSDPAGRPCPRAPLGPEPRRPRPPAVATRSLVIGWLALGLPGACAKRTDERVRAAWGGSSQAPVAPGRGRRGGPPREAGAEAEQAPVLEGWARVDEILDGAIAEASLGTDDEALAHLAERWCETVPEPQRSDDGPVLVCRPDPPVQIDGQAFSLELGGEGVIGVVAAELSAESSTALVQQALDRLERWCTRPWSDVSPRPIEPPPSETMAQLYSCPVEGSALLVVARFVSDEQAGQWRASVAVIDAS